MNLMTNSCFILQIHHAKSFKMRHLTYLYFIHLSRYSLIQIQVTILLSGTDVMFNPQHTVEFEFFQPELRLLVRLGREQSTGSVDFQ